MKVLELFCGTKSVGKVFGGVHGDSIISVDIDPKQKPDICGDILTIDYKTLWNEGDFDFIWASPPCCTFSKLRETHIGRDYKNKGIVYTRESIEADINNIGVPILRRAQEIIEYLKPKFWVIENPQTGRMKEFIDSSFPFVDVDYCMYGFNYRKRTRLWTNIPKVDIAPLLCDKSHLPHYTFGNSTARKKLGFKEIALNEKYRVPSVLIESIRNAIVIND